MVMSGETEAMGFGMLRGLDMAVGAGDMELGDGVDAGGPEANHGGTGPPRNHLRIFHASEGLSVTVAKGEM
jgi:hypothetical protein